MLSSRDQDQDGSDGGGKQKDRGWQSAGCHHKAGEKRAKCLAHQCRPGTQPTGAAGCPSRQGGKLVGKNKRQGASGRRHQRNEDEMQRQASFERHSQQSCRQKRNRGSLQKAEVAGTQ